MEHSHTFSDPPPDRYYVRSRVDQLHLITKRVAATWEVVRTEDNVLIESFSNPSIANRYCDRLNAGEIIP